MRPRLQRLIEVLSTPRALVAMAVAVVATSTGAALLATHDGTPDDPADTAFLDSRATAELVSSTSDLVDRVFSVDPRHPKAQPRLVAEHLSPEAQEQFRKLYAPYLGKKAAGITLRTTATSVGVLRLQGDRAEVLVVADQRAAAPDGRSNSGTAGIRLSLAGGSGAWRITAIDPV
jgi:Mce-associated membrane protein